MFLLYDCTRKVAYNLNRSLVHGKIDNETIFHLTQEIDFDKLGYPLLHLCTGDKQQKLWIVCI